MRAQIGLIEVAETLLIVRKAGETACPTSDVKALQQGGAGGFACQRIFQQSLVCMSRRIHYRKIVAQALVPGRDSRRLLVKRAAL